MNTWQTENSYIVSLADQSVLLIKVCPTPVAIGGGGGGGGEHWKVHSSESSAGSLGYSTIFYSGFHSYSP